MLAPLIRLLECLQEPVMRKDPDHLDIQSEKGKVIIDHPSCSAIHLSPEQAMEAGQRLFEEATLAEGKKHERGSKAD